MEVLIGTGGWGYFNVPGNKLKAYSQAFDFVEVNSTFYKQPSLATVRKWKSFVHKDFTFSMKCSRELSHYLALEPVPKAYDNFDYQKKILKTLGSNMLVIQTPSNFSTPPEKIKDFFSSIHRKGIEIIWEPRGDMAPLYRSLALDLDISPSVDLSYQDPEEGLDILYTRIFGPGDSRKSDLEDKYIKKIDEKIKKSKAKKVIVTFHGSKMYKDAARFLVYRKKQAKQG